eukprot:gnl/TRDRNA2_/TRDRNA2_161823_c0_seq1.p1 gnl/TRDRNA2_/TRDRNA2_161823_c0~~gnl/TRDRNA2_/TRDRNA2_161823_c0_seq1.p1  ORF type:complete len:300 (+),score=47.70 gnl/TRDRNA2_/TRDRNA2_161823_c0_seq1:2-901(+)
MPIDDASTGRSDVAEVPKHIIDIVYNMDQRDNWSNVFVDLRYQRSHRSWLCVFPNSSGFSHQMYTVDGDGRACVEELFPALSPWMRTGAMTKMSQQEVARTCLLYKHGGLYKDADYEVVRDFWDDLHPGLALVVESPYENDLVQLSLMASPPKHPLWPAIVCEMKERIHSPFFIDMWAVEQTGAPVMKVVMQRAKRSRSLAGRVSCALGLCGACLPPESVDRFPCQQFQPNKMTGVAPHGAAQQGQRSICDPGIDQPSALERIKAIHWNLFSWSSPKVDIEPGDEKFVRSIPEIGCRDA